MAISRCLETAIAVNEFNLIININVSQVLSQ